MLGPNPFVGPRPFEPGEPIFGRDREIKDLYYLLTADRIVVLHSPSGAGKSSLIQAGLIPRLQPTFDIWGPTRINLTPGVEGNHLVLSTILGFEEKIPEKLRRTPQSLGGQTLAEYFAGRPRRRSAPPDTVLIFDQFEEILTVDPLAVAAKEEFFDQLGELLRNPNVWALFILREDYLAPLAPYARRVPTQLQNRFRIDLLNPEQAEQVMVELARIGGRQFPAAAQLAADLSRVKVQQTDGSFCEEIGQHIEPVQLQVVCRRLWDEMPTEDLSIDADNLEQFADVDEALGAYYAASVHKIANPQARAEDTARPIKSTKAAKPAETSAWKSDRGDRRRPFGVTFLALFTWLVSLAILREQPTLEFATFPWDWLWTAIGGVGIWAGFALWRCKASALLAQSLFIASGLLSFLGMLFAYYLSAPKIGTSYQWNRANLIASIVVFLMPMVMVGLVSVFYLKNQQTRRDRGSGDTGHQRLSLVRLLAGFHLAYGISLLLWSIQPIEVLITKIPVPLFKEVDRNLSMLACLLGVTLIRGGVGIWRSERHSSWIAVALAALTIPGSGYFVVTFWNLSSAEELILGSMVLPVGFFVLTTAILLREHRKGGRKKSVSTGNLGVELARERAMRDWMGERLITAGGVRGQVLSEPGQSGGLENTWITKLLDTHLVRSEKRAGATWYELAHDRLMEPIRKENARWQEARLSALQSAAKIWGDHGRPPGMLLQAEELRKGELWAEENPAWMTETEGDFLAASRTARRHQRWLRGLMIGALLLAVAALGASVIAQREKNMARDLARTALASSLLEEGNTTRASLVALEIRRPEEHVQGIATFNKALAARVATATFEQASRAALSPDGQRVLSTWMSHFVQIREVHSGRALRLVGHQDRVHAAAFSPDGSRVVTAAADHTARIWDAETGKRLLFLVGHQDEVVEARFSADGTRVLTLSKDRTARLWSAETGALIAVLGGHGEEITRASMSPDGRRVVTGSEDGVARLFDTATGAPGVDLPHREAVAGEAITGEAITGEVIHGRTVAVAFSPDGTHLLTGTEAGHLRLFDAAAGEEIFVLDGAPGPISAVAFSPTGRRIAAASADRLVRIWDVTTREPSVALQGHGEKVVSMAFSPDGARLLTASFDQTARLWDARSGVEILVLRGHADRLQSAALSRDGLRVLTVTRDAVARVWDLVQDGGEVAILSGHEDTVYRARFSPDSTQIVTASADGTARIWDVATRQTVHLLSRHTREVLDAAFSPEGDRVVTASADGTARLWNTRTGEELMVARGHRREVSGAVFSRDGERFFTASADATVRMWSATSGEEIANPIPLRSAALSVTLLPDGSLVVQTTPGAQWIDPTTGRQIKRYSWGLAFALRPDGTRYVRTLRNDLRVVRIATIPFAFPFSALKIELAGHQGRVLGASFSPGGGRLITVSEDRTARIWSVASGHVLSVLSGHRESVVGASFSPDGTWVVTASEDHTARLWHVPEGDSRVFRSRLRARTRDCLPTDFRVIQLGENYVTAVLSEEACKQCVPVYFDHLQEAPLSAIETYIEAWDVYQECLRRER